MQSKQHRRHFGRFVFVPVFSNVFVCFLAVSPQSFTPVYDMGPLAFLLADSVH
ncbi:hypothetical protein LY76DRAFT_592520 [Colletotrichum caudatum]|nr:hypothetical protein LY76DRAFT_592520 [Colletotrichum caudatum]